jgi:hypothetical protein
MRIVLQRGHYPRTEGRTGAPGEQTFAVEACASAKRHILAIGHTPILINADVPDSAYRGEMFFACHYDSSTNPTASGASVGYQTEEGGLAARTWKRHYKANGWTRAFRSDNYTPALAGYYGVREAVGQGNRYAVIVEAGFQSNEHDKAMMTPERVGIAIAATVVDIFGGSCPTEVPPLPPYPGTVRMGDMGVAVRIWQGQLIRRGYRINADGIFGPATNHVVRDWQHNHGLVVDGICGRATWHSLLMV